MYFLGPILISVPLIVLTKFIELISVLCFFVPREDLVKKDLQDILGRKVDLYVKSTKSYFFRIV